MKYANLVIDNKSDETDGFYTYACGELEIKVGQKVRVPFARGNKERDAYVFELIDQPKDGVKNIKTISSICEEVSLNAEIISTCRWMRKRYLCRYIDGLKNFTPVGSPSKTGKQREPREEIIGEISKVSQLTEEQIKTLKPINNKISRQETETFLLRGVTGSGKTEVYMQAIATACKIGRTAIMLVPEISLTPQMIHRFTDRFGKENIAILHSKLSQGVRYDQWQKIKNKQVKIVIGARSAVFAPLEDIGVIVIDEEHEATYKSDKSPKYDTAEVAIMRARHHGAVVICGSATPSVVSQHRGQEGIYKLLTMEHRYNLVEMPQVTVVNMGQELREGNKSVLSRQLYNAMSETLQERNQVILFLNRRGYSTFVSCRDCGYVLKCPHCDISLTQHKENNIGLCHYCGYSKKIDNTCPDCGSKHMRYFGTGTEKIEETVAELFTDKVVGRIDLDTTKKKGELVKLLKEFGKGKIDILIGTQMIAKGLDFKNVGLVGIVAADISLNIPDFRSAEKTFQLLTQAAGRAGRGADVGKVIIQTYSPEHYAITTAAEQDYKGFYEKEIQLRQIMAYPPFGDIIQVIFVGTSKEIIGQVALKWVKDIREKSKMGESVLNPVTMQNIGKKQEYKEYILIKSPKGYRSGFMKILEELKANKKKAKINKKENYQVIVDVNPYNIWRS